MSMIRHFLQVLLLALLCFACSATEPEPGYKVYHNSDVPLTLQYPATGLIFKEYPKKADRPSGFKLTSTLGGFLQLQVVKYADPGGPKHYLNDLSRRLRQRSPGMITHPSSVRVIGEYEYVVSDYVNEKEKVFGRAYFHPLVNKNLGLLFNVEVQKKTDLKDACEFFEVCGIL